MKEQTALAEVLEKYGTTDWKGRKVAKIALHKIGDYDLVNAGTLLSLPYSFDDSGEIKYAVRRVDQVINLEVWK
jgi:hypothetical protein